MNFIQIIFGIFSVILAVFFSFVMLALIISFFQNKFGGDAYLKPLDELDGAKLSSMVDEQIGLYLTPLLQAKGYSQEQIKGFLTSKPIGTRPFLRQ
jgi:hypothetical protein